MNKTLTLALGGIFCLMTATACDSQCDTFCEYVVDCFPEVVERSQGFSSCDWEDDDEEATEKCVESCEDAYDKLSDGEAESVDECMECLDEDFGGSCSASKWGDAMEDECDSECDDDFGEEFWDEFNDDLSDLECTGGIY